MKLAMHAHRNFRRGTYCKARRTNKEGYRISENSDTNLKVWARQRVREEGMRRYSFKALLSKKAFEGFLLPIFKELSSQQYDQVSQAH